MKIDEGCIERNAMQIIKQYTDSIYECVGSADDKVAWMTLATIVGVLEMAEALKEVLKE